MLIHERENIKRVTIHPGEYFATNENVIISTLLGSCVSACLYDPVSRVVGMNHFLLSNRRYVKDLPVVFSEAGRYGIHAMELLINEMLKQGAKRANMLAKVFGGGSVFQQPEVKDSFFCVGNVNCRFVREFLEIEHIKLVAADLGGTSGRIIHFHAENFAVFVKRVRQTISHTVVEKERQVWKRDIEQHEQEVPNVDVWE